MKKLLLIQFALLSGMLTQAQNLSYEWAGPIGGSTTDQGNSVIVDKYGNVYSTGFFTDKADFDPDPKGTEYLTSNGGSDIYISKLDVDGKFVWAINIGGSYDDAGNSINVDASGNIYVTGYFQDMADFNPGTKTYLTSAGGKDIFVCKFDASGNYAWAYEMGGSSDDAGQGIDVDAKGNVFTTGYFQETADFNPSPKATADLKATGSLDIFVSRLDNSGNYVWAGQMGGKGDDAGLAIALDSLGNTFTTGYFTGYSNFNPDPKGTGYYLTAVSDADIFVSKFDAKNVYSWAVQAGEKGTNAGTGIVVDAVGNNYTTGYFLGAPDFNPAAPVKGNQNIFQLTSNGDYDIFVWKLDAAGKFDWAVNMGGTEDDKGFSITQDNAKNIYTTGYFRDAVDFDPGSGTTTLTSTGNNDVFFSKLDASGAYSWAAHVGDAKDDNGYSIAVDRSRAIYTTGNFVSTVDFDPGSGTQSIASSGDEDAFVLKLSTCKASTSNITLKGCNSYFYQGKTHYNSGTYVFNLKNSTGCDSIVTVDLIINSSTIESLNIGACKDYTLNGVKYTAEGTYTQTLVNKAGCDSFLVLELKFLTSNYSYSPKSCDSYTANGKTYTKSGKYTQVIPNAAGCDSTITINLTVKKTTSAVIPVTECNSYTLKSQTYTVSGTYFQTMQNAADCDSNVTLQLTINYSSSGLLDHKECSSFTLNSKTYDKSGTYVQMLKNTKGCDSTLTLKLAINNTDTSITKVACKSFILNSQSYNQTGVYNQKIMNSKGCDSSITLHLTINNAINTVTKVGGTLTADAPGAIYQWLDCNKANSPIPGEIYQNFTPTVTGDYAVQVTQNSCTDNSQCLNVKVGKIDKKSIREVKVAPNPTTGESTVLLSQHLNNGTVKVMNTSGQVLIERSNLNLDSFSIDLREHAKGIYFIEISDAGSFSRIKLVKN